MQSATSSNSLSLMGAADDFRLYWHSGQQTECFIERTGIGKMELGPQSAGKYFLTQASRRSLNDSQLSLLA